ncbi:MAG TPA: hypothetical protein VG406_16425 [Isosphaeraceae bacterium]|jgi:hypothetical protein|nr:hypothetical protein [Isosphaeraceae bacterium]
MATRRTRLHLIDLLMMVVLCGLIAAAVRWFLEWREMIGAPGPPPAGLTFGGFFGLVFAFLAWSVAWRMIRGKRAGPECRECGRHFVPGARKGDAAERCLSCRQRSFGPAELKKEETKGRTCALVLLVCVTILVGVRLSDFVAAHFGDWYWVALPLVSAGAVVGAIVLLILALIVVTRVRHRLLRREHLALARARKVTGEDGELVRTGTRTVWYSGTVDPVPLLTDAEEAVRRRATAMLGESVGRRTPLRILCFHRREGLLAYDVSRLTKLCNFDGLRDPGPATTFVLSTEVVPHRLASPEATARTLFAGALIEDLKGFPLRLWLQQGLIGALAGGVDRDETDRLNRKLLAALAVGTAPGLELFRMEPKAFVKLLYRWTLHDNFVRRLQFLAQSWSLVEYLGGDTAPEDRRGRFRMFVKDLRPKEPDEAAFERHFGHGYDRLLELWTDWVRVRGVGTHAQPPPEVRQAIVGRVVPIVRDRRAPVMERVVAVRELGRLGYAVGSDALIDLLREPAELPVEELLWSLRAISGLDLGDDPGRWSSWFSGLPEEVVATPADTLPTPVT